MVLLTNSLFFSSMLTPFDAINQILPAHFSKKAIIFLTSGFVRYQQELLYQNVATIICLMIRSLVTKLILLFLMILLQSCSFCAANLIQFLMSCFMFHHTQL